jgi:glycosyltransferase involved in cell wall biosynthesis
VVQDIRQRFPFDRILATWAYPDVFGAVLIARRFRVPLVAKVHGSDINLGVASAWRRGMIVWALRRSAAVVAVSEALKSQLVRLGIAEERIAVIPNGVDAARFTPMDRGEARRAVSLPEGGRRVVFIGHLTDIKGVRVLLDAMARLPADVRLTLVGDGDLRAALEAKAAQPPLRGRVQFAGARPHGEVPLWINAADVCCLPSFSEGCPNAAVEALACGRPVIATSVGGLPELLRRADQGTLVPPGDPAALAQALAQALARRWDPETVKRGISGYGWVENAQRMADLLEQASLHRMRSYGAS